MERALDSRTQLAFLALILAQATHSVEEYLFRLYDVFGPAKFVASLVSEDLARGFLIANIVLVMIAFLCYVAAVRGYRACIWLWIVIELINGVVHPLVAIRRRGYFPGVVTAPILFLLSIYLAMRLFRHSPIVNQQSA